MGNIIENKCSKDLAMILEDILIDTIKKSMS
jgi:hypothetical protein